MTDKAETLRRLEQVARLKSDIQMRHLSAFRAQILAVKGQVGQLRDELEAIYQSRQPFSVSEARLMNALAGQKSRMLTRAEAELARMLPGFETARQDAVRAFGRAEALGELHDLNRAGFTRE